MSSVLSADKYAWKLKQHIQQLFADFVNPSNVLPVFHKYNSSVLVKADFDNINAVIFAKGNHDGAVCLLEKLYIYDAWFECLLEVLRDPSVKLSHVADRFEQDKSALDLRLQQESRSPEGEIKKLHEEIRQREQRLSELTAEIHESDLARQGAGQVMGAHNRSEQLIRKRAHQAILDSSLEQNREHPDEEVRKLHEEIHKRDQKIMELEAGSNKHKQDKEEASQVTGTHSHKKKLTGKVYTELENLDNTIEQERMEHEVKLRQLEQEKDQAIAQERKRWEEEVKERDCTVEQERKHFEEEAKRREQESEQQRNQIKMLKEEREKLEQVIQQEREHQSKEITKLKEETRQKDQLITNLRKSIQGLKVQKKTSDATTTRTLSTKKSDGVILWNYCLTKENPNIAVKYGLTQSDLPPHLQAAGRLTCEIFFLYRDDCEQVRVHGLTVAKDRVQARLRNILNKVNMRRRENEDDVIIKYKLQCDIRDFFSSCYSCILALDTHPVNSVKECLMYIKDSITENMDPLVEEFGGWNDVMSETTFNRYWEVW